MLALVEICDYVSSQREVRQQTKTGFKFHLEKVHLGIFLKREVTDLYCFSFQFHFSLLREGRGAPAFGSNITNGRLPNTTSINRIAYIYCIIVYNTFSRLFTIFLLKHNWNYFEYFNKFLTLQLNVRKIYYSKSTSNANIVLFIIGYT